MVSSISVPPSRCAAAEHVPAALVAELDPGALESSRSPVQQHRTARARPVLPPGWPRPGQPGQVDGGVLVDEREQHEFGEAAVRSWIERITRRWPTQCAGYRRALHHRGRGAQARLVRGGDHLDPHRGGQLALGQHPPHLVVGISAPCPAASRPPASLARTSHSLNRQPVREAPFTTSIGRTHEREDLAAPLDFGSNFENMLFLAGRVDASCMHTSGTGFPGLGGTSRSAATTACTRRIVRRWANAQNGSRCSRRW